jgi:hypothetical protein
MTRVVSASIYSRAALALLSSTLACTNPPPVTATPDLATTPTSDLLSRPLLAVVGSDFTSGALSTVDPGSRAVRKNLDVVDAQPVARAFGSKLYVLDQTHGALRIYDAAQDFKNPLDVPVSQTGVVDGAQANPHDIYIDAQRQLAYLTLYGSLGSTQVTASRAIGVIDLKAPAAGLARFIALGTAAADTDGNPEADRLVGCGDTLYVTLQDLDRKRSYVAASPGRLAVLNLSSPGTPSYIQLAGENPSGLAVFPGCTEAIVGSAADQYGGTQLGKGGIERVDLLGLKTLGLALTDMELGGNVSALDAVDAAHVFADLQVKSGMTFNNTVYAVDAVAKKKGAALLGPMSFVAAVRVLDGRLVVLSAGSAGAGQLAPGLYLGAASGAPLTDPAVDVGLPPQSVALVYQ